MNQAFFLDRVIRQVASDTVISAPDEKLVTIDIALRKAITRKRLFHAAKYFVVTNNSASCTGAECVVPPIEIKDFKHDRTVALRIHYHVHCNPGNEQKVAENLFDGPHPGAVLNGLIRKYLMEYIGHQPAEFIDQFYERQSDLQSVISQKAYHEIGLNVLVKFSFEGDQLLHPKPIGPLELSVRVQDYDVSQQIKIRGELEVDERNKIHAVLYRSGDWVLEDIIKREICQHFATSVSLHSFCTQLNDKVKPILVEHLNHVLKSTGRRVSFLSLESNVTEDSVIPFFETSQDVGCRIQQYPEPVIIKNMVQMTLQDLARYRVCKSPKLNDWIQAKLDRVIHELLFDARYIDLLLDFESVAEKIKQRLGIEAELIGYTIKQLIAVPDLKPLVWLKSFSLHVEQSFKTKYSGAEVKLEIVGSARINDLRDVKHYLNPGQDIPQLIEKSIRKKVAEFLHRVDPERFYMRFSFEDEHEKSVEQEIIEIVKKIITDEFHAEVIQVIPKVVDTEYIIHLRDLQKEMGEFVITISSLNHEDIETFTYKGFFRIEAVDANGWNKFRLLNSSIEKIQNYLQKSVQATMETLPGEMLAYRSFKELKTMEELIEKFAREGIINEFGLVIRISTVSREHTKLEEKLKETKRERLDGSLDKERIFIDRALSSDVASYESNLLVIHDLEKKLRDWIEAGDDEEEIAKLTKQIAKLKRAMPTGYVAQKSEFQLYLSDSSAKTNWQDLGMPKQLSAGERQSNEGEETDR
jgi:hypothetical protein